MEVTHLECATVHQLIAGFLLLHSEVDPVRHIARGVHRLSPELSRSPMLIKHRPSHLTQDYVLHFHNTILGRHIRTRKLVSKREFLNSQNWCSRPRSWQKVSKREFLNSEPLSLWIAHMASSCLSFLNLKTRSRTKNQTSPPYPQERTATHTENSRPPQQGHTTSDPQIAHKLGQQGPYGEARMDAQSSDR
jgi:hypothetical protein